MNHTISLDPKVEQRLLVLARKRRLTPDQLLQELVDEQFLELAASDEADDVYARYLAGEESTVSMEELEKRIGMED